MDAYIIICALIIFNVEPDTFDNFFSAIYWATVSLTTMGYGDIYPVSTIGRYGQRPTEENGSSSLICFTTHLELTKMLTESIRKTVSSGKIPTERMQNQRKKVFREATALSKAGIRTRAFTHK